LFDDPELFETPTGIERTRDNTPEVLLFWWPLLKTVTASFADDFDKLSILPNLPPPLFSAVQGVLVTLRVFPRSILPGDLIACVSELNYATGLLAYRMTKDNEARIVGASFAKLTDFLAIMDKVVTLVDLAATVRPAIVTAMAQAVQFEEVATKWGDILRKRKAAEERAAQQAAAMQRAAAMQQAAAMEQMMGRFAQVTMAAARSLFMGTPDVLMMQAPEPE
jgi:hypothetical protein